MEPPNRSHPVQRIASGSLFLVSRWSSSLVLLPPVYIHMGWLRFVGSLKWLVPFAEYRLFYMALLQKRPIILRSLLIEANPYIYSHMQTCSSNTLQHTATHCNTLQRTATHCYTLQYIYTYIYIHTCRLAGVRMNIFVCVYIYIYALHLECHFFILDDLVLWVSFAKFRWKKNSHLEIGHWDWMTLSRQ